MISLAGFLAWRQAKGYPRAAEAGAFVTHLLLPYQAVRLALVSGAIGSGGAPFGFDFYV